MISTRWRHQACTHVCVWVAGWLKMDGCRAPLGLKQKAALAGMEAAGKLWGPRVEASGSWAARHLLGNA